jgi:hypothetical protein
MYLYRLGLPHLYNTSNGICTLSMDPRAPSSWWNKDGLITRIYLEVSFESEQGSPPLLLMTR